MLIAGQPQPVREMARRTLAMKGLKYCPSCQEVLDLYDFNREASRVDGRQAYCKTCSKAKNQKYRDSLEVQPSQRSWIRKQYGMEWEEYTERMKASCAICGEESHHMDHNHTTGQAREPLCRHCNMALGQLKEDPQRMRAMIEYVETWNG